LTAKGERQAARMARWLNQHLPEGTRVLVSPTLRTVQTAQGLDRRKRVLEALGPDQSVEALLHAARWPDAKEPVVVVGHQPTLGLTAAYLLAGVMQPWPVRKGALWWIRRREREAQVEILLHASLSSEHV
jgi:phosphohistidine phosphatase